MQDPIGGALPQDVQARGRTDYVTVIDAIDLYARLRRAVTGAAEPENPVFHEKGALQSSPPRVSAAQVEAERAAARDIALAVRGGKLRIYHSRTGSPLPAQLSPGDIEYLDAKVRVPDVVALADPYRELDASLPGEHAHVVEASAAETDETAHHGNGEPTPTEEPQAPQIKPKARQDAQEEAILETIHDLGYDPHALPAFPGGRIGGAKSEVKRKVTERFPNLFRHRVRVFDKAWERLRACGAIHDE